MKGILIDPQAKTVTEVEFDGNYQQIYKLIDASPFDVVRLGEHDGQEESMFVDDEGLYREPQFFFKLSGNGPFAGKALILGSNDEGDSVATKLDAKNIEAQVEFVDVHVSGWTPPREEKDVDMPWGGKGFQIIGAQPIFGDGPKPSDDS